MRLILLILTLAASLAACNKPEKFDVVSYWYCHQSQNLDSAAISTKLIGSWTRTKKACFGTGGMTESPVKIIKVTFRTDGTFSVNESTTVLTQGTWKIKQVDGPHWGLDLSPLSEYLLGRILFCDKQVLFNDSYRDACDNLFDKE